MSKPDHAGWRRRYPGMSLRAAAFYALCRGLCNLLFKLVYRRIVLHRERAPEHGAVLLIANHQSHFDPPAIGGCLDTRACAFLARESLFHNKVFGGVISALNAVPVKRTAADTSAMKGMLQRLDDGCAVLVFPEGSRTFDGALQPFMRGVSLLIKRSSAPVVPCAIDGAFDAFPRTRSRPRLLGQRMCVAFGEPLDPAELMKDGPDAALEELAKRIDALRLEARAELRRRTKGRIPSLGPADQPMDLAAWRGRAERPT